MRKDKARDIARGVLPSTARKGARDSKREYHAKHRHAQRQVNHAITRHCATVSDHGTIVTDADLYDDFEAIDTYDGYNAATKVPTLGWYDMTEIVRDRRDADKLGPLLSWARATEKNKMVGWSDEDKHAYFKAVLPDTLQGRHALGHIETALHLYTDEFLYGYRKYGRPELVTKDKLRAGLSRHLSTTKSRLALREFLCETVPVAAHSTYANNKTRSRVPAVDEDGKARYWRLPNGQTYPIMVDVYVPQVVTTTCDDCTFLRNDPLATTAAINRFIDLVWAGRYRTIFYRRRDSSANPEHDFIRDIFTHIYNAA